MRPWSPIILALLLGSFTVTGLRADLLLSGSVTDHSGSPVAGADIRFWVQSEPSAGGGSQTDAPATTR